MISFVPHVKLAEHQSPVNALYATQNVLIHSLADAALLHAAWLMQPHVASVRAFLIVFIDPEISLSDYTLMLPCAFSPAKPHVLSQLGPT